MKAEMRSSSPIDLLGEDRIDYMTFLIGDDEFGIEFKYVHDLVAYSAELDPSPRTVSIKKKLRYDDADIAVIDLRKRVDIDEESSWASLIVLRINEELQGFLVEKVTGICRVADDEIVPVPAALSHVNYFIGLTQEETRMVILMHAERLWAKFMLPAPQAVAVA